MYSFFGKDLAENLKPLIGEKKEKQNLYIGISLIVQ